VIDETRLARSVKLRNGSTQDIPDWFALDESEDTNGMEIDDEVF